MIYKNIKKQCLISALVLLSLFKSNAQTRISGHVKDSKGEVLPYASIYLENTIDGTTSDSLGNYSFKTREKGKKVIVASFVGYETSKDTILIDKKELVHNIIVKENAIAMKEVVVTAGAFQVNDDQKVAVLTPLDIYANAGAGGDIVGAIRSLPGNQAQSDQTGLFVRGGDASESVVIIDGMIVQNPFASNVPGVSQRSRFTPFQFKGISFSSGGYSSRYGQALSSVLELNTVDLPESSNGSFALGMTGVEASAAKKWNSSALEATAHYDNIKPFMNLAKSNIDYYKAPEGVGFSSKYTLIGTKKDILKIFVKYDKSKSGIYIPFYYSPESNSLSNNPQKNVFPYDLSNNNGYFNSSYNHLVNKLLLRTAFSASNNNDNVKWGSVAAKNNDWRLEWRGEGLYTFSEKFNLLTGVELQRYRFEQNYSVYNSGYTEFLPSGYVEGEWKPANWLAVKPGLRFEHSQLLNKNSLAPRVALAIGTGKYSQISLASGMFYQNADKKFLLAVYKPGFQLAVHYIANYQVIKNDRTFRIEGYYKSYNDLVRERLADTVPYNANSYRLVYGEIVDNSGNGYAKGIDFFWRDKATIHNFDYWISYSFIDTRRLYENYEAKVSPSFVSKHNLNVLTKYFIEPINLNVGLSYTYASGRPAYNPEFAVKHAPDYHSIAFNCTYMLTVGRYFGIVYMTIDNLTGRKNIFGYNYSPNGAEYPMRPTFDRWIYAGFTISLTRFSKDEL